MTLLSGYWIAELNWIKSAALKVSLGAYKPGYDSVNLIEMWVLSSKDIK